MRHCPVLMMMILLAAGLAVGLPVLAEEAAPSAEGAQAEEAPAPTEAAPAAPAPAEQAQTEQPAIDKLLEELAKIGPEALAQRVAEMKAQAEALAAQAAGERKKAEELEAQAAALRKQIETIENFTKAVTEAMSAAPAESAPEEPAMAPAPAEGMTEAAPAAAAPLINYQEHILPIFQERCVKCHNADRARGGLNLAVYGAAMEGGSSGAVIAPGDPGGSRLFRLASQQEEPKMPPSGDPLSAEQLELLRRWIELGAVATSADAPMVAQKDPAASQEVYIAAAAVDGPPPMPEGPLETPKPAEGAMVAARAVAASPTAPLLAVGGDRQALLYNVADNTLLGALPFPEGDIFTMSFSVNGELLLAGGGRGGDSGAVVVWNVRKAERAGVYGEGYDTVLAADISPDHKMIAVGGPDKIVRVYSLPGGAALYEIKDHTDWILAAKFTPDGELLATADRAGGLYLWQAANGRPVEQLQGHTGPVHSLAYTRDSAVLASAGEDGTVQLWDTWKYSRIRSFGAHNGAVTCVDFSPDNEIITTGVDRQVKRWDLNGKELSKYEPLADWGYQARFAAQGQVVLAGCWTGEVSVWRRDSGEKLAALGAAPGL